MRSLLGKSNCVFSINDRGEMCIAIDCTHEPWSIIGRKLLILLKEELEAIDYDMEGLDDTIKLIDDNAGRLQ